MVKRLLLALLFLAAPALAQQHLNLTNAPEPSDDSCDIAVFSTADNDIAFTVSNTNICYDTTDNRFEVRDTLTVFDGTTDSPQFCWKPATGTEWCSYVEDAGDDLQIQVTSAVEETLDLVNTGAGTLTLSIADGNLSMGSSVSDRIYLFGTTYGMGIDTATFASWIPASSKFSWRTPSRTGTELGLLNTSGQFWASGAISVGTQDFGSGLNVKTATTADLSLETTGGTPREWIIRNNAGTFAIVDQTAATTPFTILGAAPNNSFYMDAEGDVGFGTSSPGTYQVAVNGDSNFDGTLELGSGATGDMLYLGNGTNYGIGLEASTWVAWLPNSAGHKFSWRNASRTGTEVASISYLGDLTARNLNLDGTAPTISATGVAADIDLVLAPKGTGTVDINLDCSTGDQYLTTNAAGQISCGTDDSGGGTFTSFDITDTDATPILTVDDGEQIQFIGAGTVTVAAAADAANHDVTITGSAHTADQVGTVNDGQFCQGGAGSVLDCDVVQNAGTDITADLEEEAHASEHDGVGIVASGEALDTASQEAGFLEDGGAVSLTCGAAAQGKMQVLDDGSIEYCDGATTSVLRAGFLDADGVDDTGTDTLDDLSDDTIAAHASSTSANLGGVLSDETGAGGVAVFSANPTLAGVTMTDHIAMTTGDSIGFETAAGGYITFNDSTPDFADFSAMQIRLDPLSGTDEILVVGGDGSFAADGSVAIQIDADNGSADNFIIFNGASSNVFQVDESGNLTLSGTVDGVDVSAADHTDDELNSTTVTGNAADDQVLLGSGANALAYATIPDCNTNNMLTYTQSTNTWGCDADDGAGGGAPTSVQYVVGAGDATLTAEKILTDGTGIDTVLAGGDGGTATINLDYTATLAGNPALGAEESVFSTDGTGGGVLFEGATADTIEGLLVWSPTTSDRTLTLPDATDTLVGTSTTDTLTNKTLAAANNVIEADTGDSATGFFASGTLEDALIDGGNERDEVLVAAAGGTDLTCAAGVCNVDNPVTAATTATTANNLAAGGLDSLGELASALCGTNEILEDQGASWACIATPVDTDDELGATTVTGNAADDQVLLGSGANALAYATVPNCTTGNRLLYTQATNTFSCEAASATPGTDSVGTNELDDSADTPLAGEWVQVSGDTTDFVYRSDAELISDTGALTSTHTSDIDAHYGGVADDQILLGSGASTAVFATIPDCNTESMLTYTQSTNTWGCETDSTGGSPAFSAITTGTNTTATMTVGTGASIVASGTGEVRSTGIDDDGDGTFEAATVSGQLRFDPDDSGGTDFVVTSSTLYGWTTNSGGILDEASSATNPTVSPRAALDNDTGMGAGADDQLSLIAGGVEGLRVNTAASGVNYVEIIPGATGTAAKIKGAGSDSPADLWFVGNQASAGFYFDPQNDGIADWEIDASRIRADGVASGPAMLDQDPTTTNPVFVPYWNDEDTGLGGDTTDTVSLIAGGTEGLTVTEGDYSMGVGDTTLFISDVVTAPSTNPTGGVLLYSDANKLYIRDTTGTTTDLTTGTAPDFSQITTGTNTTATMTVGTGGSMLVSGTGTIAASSIDTDGDGTQQVYFSGNNLFFDPDDDTTAEAAITTNGYMRADSGAVNTPGLSFFGDTNTGIYNTADTVHISAGGVEGLRVNTAASGVRYVNVTPSAAGGNPKVSASAGDLYLTTDSSGCVSTDPDNDGTPNQRICAATWFADPNDDGTDDWGYSSASMSAVATTNGATIRTVEPSASSVVYTFKADPDTGLTTDGADEATITAGGAGGLTVAEGLYGTAATDTVLWINDVVTAPTSNPTGGVLLYSDANTLYIRDTTGTVTDVLGAGSETNDLEANDPPTIQDTEIYVGNGAASGTFVTVSGDASLANTGALTIANASVEEAMLATADFGDFSCGAGAGDCTLDTGAVSATEIETAPAISGANIDSFPENFCKTLFDSGGLADTDDIDSIWRFKGAATVTEVWCETDTGTATITLQDGGATALASSCSCTSTGGTCTLSTTGFTDGELLDFVMVTAAGNRLTFCVEYDLD